LSSDDGASLQAVAKAPTAVKAPKGGDGGAKPQATAKAPTQTAPVKATKAPTKKVSAKATKAPTEETPTSQPADLAQPTTGEPSHGAESAGRLGGSPASSQSGEAV
jgi:hypothetical protein